MPPRRKRRTPERKADAPLHRPPVPPLAIDPQSLTARLRLIHEQAEDPRVEQMPSGDELWGVLLYCEHHASALRDPRLAREAALLCVQLWEHVRHQQELHEGRAARRAQDAGATWGDLAGPFRVTGPSGAYQKARRLQAVEMSTRPEVGPVRRTPEAVARVERELVEAERRRRLRQFTVEDQEEEWVAHARALLQVGASLPRDDAGIISFWLEQMEYDLNEGSPARAIAHDVQSLLSAVKIASKHLGDTEGPDVEIGKILAGVWEFVSNHARLSQ